MTLANCKVGFKGLIKNLSDIEANIYLLENGFTPGQEVEILSVSPFGGPIGVQIRGTILALRREEALCIQV